MEVELQNMATQPPGFLFATPGKSNNNWNGGKMPRGVVVHEGDSFNDPSVGLVLGHNEQVLSHLDGARNAKNCFVLSIYVLFTFGLYLCVYKKRVQSVLCTNKRTVFHERILQGSNGTIMAYTQTAFFNSHLAGGVLKFAGATLNLTLDFVKFTESDLNVKRKVKAKTGCCCGLFDGCCRKGEATFDTQSINVTVTDNPQVITSKGNLFLMTIIETSGTKEILRSPSNPNSFVVSDGLAALREDQVAIDQNVVALGRDERVVDAMNSIRTGCCKKFHLVFMSIITLGIYYLLHLYCFPYERGFVAVTDRRVINARYVTRGKKGSVATVGYALDLHFWMMDKVASGSLRIEKRACFPCCGKPTAHLDLVTKRGSVSFTPDLKQSAERTRDFVRVLMSTSNKGALKDASPHPSLMSTPLPMDLILQEGETALIALNGRKKDEGITRFFFVKLFANIFTFGFFPKRTDVSFVITTHRIISIDVLRYACFSCCDLRSEQHFYQLDKVIRSMLKRERKCGCGACCSFGHKMYLEALIKGKGGIAQFEYEISGFGTQSNMEEVELSMGYLAMLQDD